jgi:hypothetical protein
MGVLMLVPFVLYTMYSVADKFAQTARVRQQAAVIRAELEAEKLENVRLQEELVRARSDEEIERAARVHLNLVKPGDKAVVLLGAPPRPTPTPSLPAPTEAPDEVPAWLDWLLTQLRL